VKTFKKEGCKDMVAGQAPKTTKCMVEPPLFCPILRYSCRHELAAEKPLSCLQQCISWTCGEALGVGVQGFVIGAHSVAGSKFKLLMFEATEEGQWELLLQEDSIRVSPSVILLHLTASTRH
jgi:hypothetical protein